MALHERFAADRVCGLQTLMGLDFEMACHWIRAALRLEHPLTHVVDLPDRNAGDHFVCFRVYAVENAAAAEICQ